MAGGSVNTNGHDYSLPGAWNSRKLTPPGARSLSRCRAALPASPIAPCSPPSCLSPRRAAKGTGDRSGLTPGPLYTRLPRRSPSGVRARVFEPRHRAPTVRLRREARSPARPLVQIPPAGTGALTKPAPSLGQSRGGGTAKIHMVAADARPALAFARSPGPAPAFPAGRQWRNRLGPPPESPALLRDRASAGAKPRHLAVARGEEPVVPPRRPGVGLGRMPVSWSSDSSASHPSLRRCDSVNRP